MDYYIDIRIKPDAEMRENVLLNKVYTKFHKALFSMNATDIGISFPNYKVILGNVIRLHGSHTRLVELQDIDWLGGLKGDWKVSDVQAIPSDTTHRKVSRKQANMTAAKLRRLIKRNSISHERAKKYKAKMFNFGLDNPFLELESASNGNKHRRYLQFSELLDKALIGKFDQFGLSKTATVPWF